jgi:nicotinamide-nucleotide amidase
VSAHVAAAMAGGVRDRLQATYGVALTGVAGPDPQDGNQPGTVFVAVAGPGDGQVRELTVSGDRRAVREAAVDAAIELLRDLLEDAREA